jgi:hypothetical protein
MIGMSGYTPGRHMILFSPRTVILSGFIAKNLWGDGITLMYSGTNPFPSAVVCLTT